MTWGMEKHLLEIEKDAVVEVYKGIGLPCGRFEWASKVCDEDGLERARSRGFGVSDILDRISRWR
jgi:hypothetical protein